MDGGSSGNSKKKDFIEFNYDFWEQNQKIKLWHRELQENSFFTFYPVVAIHKFKNVEKCPIFYFIQGNSLAYRVDEFGFDPDGKICLLMEKQVYFVNIYESFDGDTVSGMNVYSSHIDAIDGANITLKNSKSLKVLLKTVEFSL